MCKNAFISELLVGIQNYFKYASALFSHYKPHYHLDNGAFENMKYKKKKLTFSCGSFVLFNKWGITTINQNVVPLNEFFDV